MKGRPLVYIVLFTASDSASDASRSGFFARRPTEQLSRMNALRLPSLAVFDVGGTMVKDSADVAAVFLRSLAEHDLSPSRAEIQRWRGAAKREVVARLVGKSITDAEAVYATFRRNLIDAFLVNGIESIPGADAAVATLRRGGVRVMLTTGFDGEVARTLLRHLQWDRMVDGIVSADDVRAGRPAPDMIHEAMTRADVKDPRGVVNVGDTTNDLVSGAAAGVGANLGVLTGAHSRAELESVNPTAILDSAASVPDWLSRFWRFAA
jgi:phosphonatase-like hydrolase